MTNPAPQYLRLYRERVDVQPTIGASDITGLPEFCRAFETATRWSLSFASGNLPRTETDLLWSAPVDPGVGTTPGHLRIGLSALAEHDDEPQVALNTAGQLAGSMATMLAEFLRT
ncbi:MAG TPA: hypothetical protein VHV77_07870, partial [Pirellulales bacterium]|nr:hypothetical protein [Pirellulales bacterium]